MKLYIHFGIYKAGSSFIQYVLANSRDYLEQNGIYFPASVSDNKMLKGLISPGNADCLEQALKNQDTEQCEKLFRKWKREANSNNSHTVLISAEALVHQMVKTGELQILIESATRAGFNEIHAMGFFRDLADHALSTYKHRAKSGNIPDFEHWITRVYETPQLLDKLFKIRSEKLKINWTFRKFQKNGEKLLKIFFEDWLQIAKPEFKGRPAVNESVTLSEVLLMNQLRELYPYVTDYFVQDLKALCYDKKASDKNNEAYLKTIFSSRLKIANDIIRKLNRYFDEGETLELIQESNMEQPGELIIQLSGEQMKVIGFRIKYFRGLSGRIILCRRWLKNIVGLKLK